MLQKIGVKSLDELIDKTIPANIRLKEPLALPKTMTEYEFGQHIAGLAAKNKLYTTYIGMGWYNTITPAVIQRNVFENPVWYTSYTPYQTEVSQGRLEALMNFQTAVCDLTGMPLANCSLLDEATAAAEAVTMMYALRPRDMQKSGANVVFVDEGAIIFHVAGGVGILQYAGEDVRCEFHFMVFSYTQLDTLRNGTGSHYCQRLREDGFVNKYHVGARFLPTSA